MRRNKKKQAQQAKRLARKRKQKMLTGYLRRAKVDKGHARKAWGKLKPGEALLARMLKALDWQKRSQDWRKDGGQYIPYPATWLNGERWEDEERQPPDDDFADRLRARCAEMFEDKEARQRE